MSTNIFSPFIKPTPHISGGNELKPTPYISDSKTQLTPINEVETINPEEAQHEVTVGSRALEAPEEAEPAITEELVEVATLNREPITKTLPPSTLTEPAGPQRSKASQAYLDFIESSVQKLGKLVLEGFNWCWDYLKEKSS